MERWGFRLLEYRALDALQNEIRAHTVLEVVIGKVGQGRVSARELFNGVLRSQVYYTDWLFPLFHRPLPQGETEGHGWGRAVHPSDRPHLLPYVRSLYATH